MRPPRGLSRQEAALWARVAETVEPLHPRQSPLAEMPPAALQQSAQSPQLTLQSRPPRGRTPPPRLPVPAALPAQHVRPLDRHGLDGSWERKLAKAAIEPDFTLDLHGCSLDLAHSRLDHGLALAAAQGARLVLVITGRPRPAESADRGERRGAIRAKLLDWLAAGSHASRVAAVRTAHQRHGGAGALYVVLRRPR